MVTTRPSQIIGKYWGCEWYPGTPPIHTRTACDGNAHEKTRKKAKTNKLPCARKLRKLFVRKTNSKIVKKNPEKNKKAEQEAQHEVRLFLS